MLKINSNPSFFGKNMSRRWFKVGFAANGSSGRSDHQKLIISYSTNKYAAILGVGNPGGMLLTSSSWGDGEQNVKGTAWVALRRRCQRRLLPTCRLACCLPCSLLSMTGTHPYQ